MRNLSFYLALLAPCVFGCGAAAVAAPAAAAVAPVAPEAPAQAATTETTSAAVPAASPAAPETPAATCVPSGNGSEGCFATEDYRAWLCDRSAPGAAVSLFRKGSPWVRAYVARDLDSWDPSRMHAQKTHLELDEEVVVLHPNKPRSDVMVVGATNAFGWSSVDAIRADGTCVSLMADEITSKRPPAPKHAGLAWDKLDDHTRTTWLAFPDVRKNVERMTKACSSAGSPGCVKARSRVTDAVVAHDE